MSTHPLSLTVGSAAACFGTIYGYRFNGDTVELHATFQLLNETVHQLQWTLQLRACPASGNVVEPLATHLVAEASLPPLDELAWSGSPFYLTAPATPPAGSGEFNLFLLLVAKDSTKTEEAHDLANFDRPERFIQPRFAGEINYQLSGDTIHLNVAAIENPRDPANLSGTLSLELWALAEPYIIGNFQGTALGGVIIGHLAGQQTSHDLAYNLAIAKPSAGRWQLVLMLREWTGSGYTTRDFFNFALPLEIVTEVASKPEPTAQAAASVPKSEPLAPAKVAPAPKTIPASSAKKGGASKKAVKASKDSKPVVATSPTRTTPPSKRTSR